MSILDTLYYVFEVDNSKLKSGLKEADKDVENTRKRLDELDPAAKKVGEAFVGLAKSIGGVVTAALGFAAVKAMVLQTADHTEEVRKQARALDMSVESLSAWRNAVTASGGDANSAVQSLTALRDKFVEMSRFGAMIGPDAFMFKQLGLSAQDMYASIKDPTIALSKLAEKFETLSHSQQLFIGKKLGLDDTTVAMLGQGRRALDELIARQKELGVVTREQTDAAMKFKLEQAKLGLSFEAVKREIVTEMLPALTWLLNKVDSMIQFFREHGTFAKAFFIGIGSAITLAFLPAVVSAAVAVWALIAPFVAVGAAIAAVAGFFALVIDDIEAFRSGQNSLIGEMSKKWPIVGQVVNSVCDVFDRFSEILGGNYSWWEKIEKILVRVVDVLMGPMATMLDKIKDLFGIEGPSFAEKFKAIVDQANNDRPTGVQADKDKQSASPQAMASKGKTTATGREIAAKLEAMGWTREQAAGIAGSFLQESTGRADAENPNSHAYGLGQWLGARVKDFEKWAGKSLRGSSLDEQLAFFQYEVTKGNEKRAGQMLRAAKTAAEAAEAHSKYYERPGAAEANIARRQRLAADILAGQRQLGATNAPIASQSSNVMNNKTSTRNNSVQVGNVNIQTQATDADSIAASVANGLDGHLKSALNYYDDGVAA